MPVSFSDALLRTRKGDRLALVITPIEHRSLGIEHLRELRQMAGESPIEQGLVQRVVASPEPHQIVVFRGRNEDGSGSWGFDNALDADEAHELARLLVISHLPTHRCLLAHGTYVMVHTDFGSREAELFRRASKEVLDERGEDEPRDELERAIHRADAWILRHLSFYFSLGFDRVMESVLPDKLPLIEMRTRHIGALVAALGPPGGGVG